MSNRTWQMYGIGLLALLLLLIFAAPFYAKRITTVLEASAKQAFQQAGLDWVRVEAEERDLKLSGNAPTPPAHQQALQTAAALFGVNNVVDHMTPRIIAPYTMNIDWHNGKLTAEGFLPDEASYQAIGKRVTETYGNNQTGGKLQLAAGNPASWTEMMDTLLANISNLERAHVNITDKKLYVSGKTPLSSKREQFTQAITQLEQQGYSVDLHIVASDEAARICQQKFNELLQTPIMFESGDTRIHPTSYPLLEKLSETAMLCPSSRITIAGYTDNRGNAATNLKLSEQRARAIAGWLFQVGIDTSRLQTVGYGSSQPVADNSSEAGRAKNRRIEFVVQGN
ncbi:OmpA family protein [Thiothrix lacustris]|uniref:OmpA family protein n=1 Tax=Thiothrix lacustris TaxID=525917 RepID=UPI0027E5924F|nr:OmpA family protein [Thiothrix lacustris]WMP19445.1 OmpA family protein [Thiothrix lacustris]